MPNNPSAPAEPTLREVAPDLNTLDGRMKFAADTLAEAVYGNAEANDISELAAWFRVGYLVEVAKMIREALTEREALLSRVTTLEQDAGRLPLPMVAHIRRELDRAIQAEGEQFKPGRMHHNGPRRLSIEMPVQYAIALRASLPDAASRLSSSREDDTND